MVKLSDLWDVAPKCHVFIKTRHGVTEYVGVDRVDLKGGGVARADSVVASVFATSYPMYGHVLEVILEDSVKDTVWMEWRD